MKTGTSLILLTSLLLLLEVEGVAAEKSKTLAVGKYGEITLSQPTQAGKLTLSPGTYVVQHRVSGGDHYVRFAEWKKEQVAHPETHEEFALDSAGVAKCRLEPAQQTFDKTMVYLERSPTGSRISKIAVGGEKVFHVFD